MAEPWEIHYCAACGGQMQEWDGVWWHVYGVDIGEDCPKTKLGAACQAEEPPSVKVVDSDVAIAAVSKLEGEVERLRARTHEIAVEKDREMAEMRSRVDRYENAFAEAREAVKDFKADWTTDPPSQQPDGFWRYTSRATVEAMAAVMNRAREIEMKYRERAQAAEDRAWRSDHALRKILDRLSVAEDERTHEVLTAHEIAVYEIAREAVEADVAEALE